MLGRLRLHADGAVEAGFTPVYVEAPGKPVLAHGDEADRVIRYIEDITLKADMPALSLRRRGDDAWLA
jgi:poly-gamma-glutamate synthesis protein (capsule biosynthesis protein)